MHYCIMSLTINSEEERKIGPLQVKKRDVTMQKNIYLKLQWDLSVNKIFQKVTKKVLYFILNCLFYCIFLEVLQVLFMLLFSSSGAIPSISFSISVFNLCFKLTNSILTIFNYFFLVFNWLISYNTLTNPFLDLRIE